MNPLIPLEAWIPLMLALVFLLLRTRRKTFAALDAPARYIALFLRLGTLLAMGVLLLNPGRYAPRQTQTDASATVLIDRSASMATGSPGRWEEAVRLATSADPNDKNLRIKYTPFGADLENAVEAKDLPNLQPDAPATGLSTALRRALDLALADPSPSRGLLVLSDGIAPLDADEARALGLAARAHRIPISAHRIGTPPQDPNLSLQLSQEFVTVTAGADRPLRGRVLSAHLPPLRKNLRLLDEKGQVLHEMALELPADSETSFELRTGPLPLGLHRLRLELAADPSETRTDDNQRSVRVNAIDVSLRVLLLEGVPHWDSKFLAQWLRGQKGVELTTLHRLADNRWFRVDPGETDPIAGGQDALPGEEEDFRSFDVILIGRGLDYLATSRSTAALHRFVRDHGGMIIFTRGRPVTGDHPGLESLVPVRWLDETSSGHHARPARAGLRSGLFGDLLPGPADPVWDDLPALRGLRRARVSDGLASVLMEATDGTEDSEPWPALVSRRSGNGRVLLIIGEGMWHWDFRPGMETGERWYGHFWTQLLLWVVQSARFQPGMEYSVEWSPSSPQPGEEIEFRVEHRLGHDLSQSGLRLRLLNEDGDENILPLRSVVGGGLQTRWQPTTPGFFALSVNNGATIRHLLLPAPPGEHEELTPRDQPLLDIVNTSGGRWLQAEDIPEVFRLPETQMQSNSGDAIWHPHWTRAYFLLALIALPALEWTLRRRRGLV
jgi:hypothetical protein